VVKLTSMASDKPQLKIGLIGTGFMGKTHVFGFAAASRVFDLPFELVLHTVADRSDALAADAARTLGFERSSGDWQSLIDDPEIDMIDITAPNALHKEMALKAIAAGKHVYCEKPLAPLAADAREMAGAAEAAGVKTQVGFNYLCNPMLGCAQEMIRSGELGEIRSYRGVHAEDYMMDAKSPFTFRHLRQVDDQGVLLVGHEDGKLGHGKSLLSGRRCHDPGREAGTNRAGTEPKITLRAGATLVVTDSRTDSMVEA
jgi:predicted dehydrogenase